MTTPPRWLDEREQSAWRGFLELHARLSVQLNRDLQTAAGLSQADYAVLVHLSEHPARRLRVLELARTMGWEKSRLSHQLSRMQQRGLIARAGCPKDRRGAFVELTDAGARTLEDAAPAHVDSVRRHLFDHLSPEQVDALDAMSHRVLDHLDGACPTRDCGTADATSVEAADEECDAARIGDGR
jgi:DNA-binding MarR family transcriptional regulator